MHIVSNVRGEVEEDKDAFDLVKAVFPGEQLLVPQKYVRWKLLRN